MCRRRTSHGHSLLLVGGKGRDVSWTEKNECIASGRGTKGILGGKGQRTKKSAPSPRHLERLPQGRVVSWGFPRRGGPGRGVAARGEGQGGLLRLVRHGHDLSSDDGPDVSHTREEEEVLMVESVGSPSRTLIGHRGRKERY